MTFDESVMKEGYIFEGVYPPEAARWCNTHEGFWIEELPDAPDGVKKYIVKTYTDKEKAARALAIKKRERSAKLAENTVEVNGRTYDANEKAQERLNRVTQNMPGSETVSWVLADNTVAEVNVSELKQVLEQAVRAQVAMWSEVYDG